MRGWKDAEDNVGAGCSNQRSYLAAPSGRGPPVLRSFESNRSSAERGKVVWSHYSAVVIVISSELYGYDAFKTRSWRVVRAGRKRFYLD